MRTIILLSLMLSACNAADVTTASASSHAPQAAQLVPSSDVQDKFRADITAGFRNGADAGR